MRFAYEDSLGRIHWLEQPFSAGPPPAQIEVPNEHGIHFDGCARQIMKAQRSYRAEQTGGASPRGWPMTCYASGVHPDDAQALRDEFKRVGVPTEVTPGGDPIYVSPEHRRRALKARGMFDKASYF